MVLVNGYRVRQLRMAKGWSQEALGDMVGASQTMIAHVERDMKNPGISTLKLMADCFGVPMEDLLKGEEPQS